MATATFLRGRGLVAAALSSMLGMPACFSEPVGGDDVGLGSTGNEGSTGDERTGMPESTGTTAATNGDEGTSGAEASTGGDAGTSTSDPDDTGADSSGGGDGSSGGSDATTGEMVLGIDDLVAGDLVITEVMWNPHCGGDFCEWIEILNATDSTVDLLDLYIRDNDNSIANQGRITENVLVAPGGYAVVARGLSNWPYLFDPAAVYGPNPGFNNGEPDRAVLVTGLGFVIDSMASFPDDPEGVAWSLSPMASDATSNDVSVNWCSATTALPTTVDTEYGTPGEPNPDC